MWVVRSWVGGLLAAVSCSLFLFINYTVSVHGVLSTLVEDDSLTPWGLASLLGFQWLWGFALWSYVQTMLSNPGTTPKLRPPADLPADQVLTCSECKQWKPPRTHHCSNCERCVHKMDRHCFWINNCIGALNLKFYMLFLLYLTGACAVAVSVLGYDGMFYATSNKRYHLRPGPILCGAFSLLICLFLMFLGCGLLLEQWSNLHRNQTSLESLQKNQPRPVMSTQRSFHRVWCRVFGKSAVLWWLPVTPLIRPHYKEVLKRRRGKFSSKDVDAVCWSVTFGFLLVVIAVCLGYLVYQLYRK